MFIYDSDGLCVTLHHSALASFQCDPADISKDVALNVNLRARSAAQEINLEKSMSFKKICLFTSLEQKSSKEYIFLPPIHVIEIVGSSKPYQVPICGGHQFASHHVQCKLPRVSTVLRSPASFAFLINFNQLSVLHLNRYLNPLQTTRNIKLLTLLYQKETFSDKWPSWIKIL